MQVSINGTIVDHITLTGSEPEFNYGYGAFETLRSYNGKPFKVQEHLERLQRSAEHIQLHIEPDNMLLTRWLANHCTSEFDVRLKIVAAVGKIYITSQPLQIDSTIYTEGVSVDLQSVERWQPTIKSLAYSQEYLAHELAVRNGHYDALLMNHAQEITEGAYCNIFSIKNDVISTPRYSILQGITRNTIIELAKPYYAIEERKLSLEELMVTDECFLTQTSAGIVPIVRIDKHSVGSGKPGPITQHLIDVFNEYVEKN